MSLVQKLSLVVSIFIMSSMIYGARNHSFQDGFKISELKKGFAEVAHQRIWHIYQGSRGSGSLNTKSAHFEFDLVDLKQRRVKRKIQKYKGVQVFGSRLVEVSWGQCLNCPVVVLGRKAKLSPMSVLSWISWEQAMAIASKNLGKSFSRARLVIYPTRKSNYLAWIVRQDDLTEKWVVFVDAKTGKILNAYNSIAYENEHGHDHPSGDEFHGGEEVDARGLGVLENEQFFNVLFSGQSFKMVSHSPAVETYRYDRSRLPGRSITSITPEFGKEFSSAVDAQSYSQKYLNFLERRFGRVGYDGLGSPLVNTVGFFKYSDMPYHNAFWNGEQVVYGNATSGKSLPFSGAFDIVVHEITHAVIHSTSRLRYIDQSGALNEAFSDIMGTYVENKLTPQKGDWTIGEDIRNPHMRYMDNPTLDGISSDHYSNRYWGTADNGGVHWNSGIANLAFSLLVEGGTHPRRGGIFVQGIGWERAIDIFYKAFTEILSPSARFIDARDATVLVAREFNKQTVSSVMQAWAAVGVGRAPEGQKLYQNPPPDTHQVIESSPRLVIPDNKKNGVVDTLSLKKNVPSFTISVNISHKFIGDLHLQLYGPSGKRYINYQIEDRGEGLLRNFTVKMRNGESSLGKWKLNVSDRRKKDLGVLESWSIHW